MSASRVRTKMDAVNCRTFACDSEPHADLESAKIKLIWKLVQVVPTQMGAQRLRVANAQAEVQVPHETHTQITIFIDLESYLTVGRIQEHECTSIYILL